MTRAHIRRVAVIGAGISGVVSAAHLLGAGLEVVVFERSHAAGGVWYASPHRSNGLFSIGMIFMLACAGYTMSAARWNHPISS
jgi:cation diffusion facilitator CzcD-associated flavoprotein CzcO